VTENDRFPVRLVNGGSPNRGRLEIFVNGSWGTVCDDHFGANETMVACRQLGYTGYVGYWTKYGEGTGNIWMDDVQCKDIPKDGPTENKYISRLSDCKTKGSTIQFGEGKDWGKHNCEHYEDVGIECRRYGKQGTCTRVHDFLQRLHQGRSNIFAFAV
jgi:hypothetical protein